MIIKAMIYILLQFNGHQIGINENGLDGIVVDSTSYKNVEQILGEPDKKDKYWEKSPWISKGNYVKVYTYEKKGIIIFMDKVTSKNWVVKSIHVMKPFAGKTKKEIGIGDTYAEISQKYGELKIYSISNGYSYIEISEPKSAVVVELICDDFCKKSDFKVDWIRITKTNQ
ncbi:MAG: hypothetical protein KDC84_08005 [Crocinitomicaceae bacterium]|nr:hypothetical protein [Crocinitomicaceae bacterium]